MAVPYASHAEDAPLRHAHNPACLPAYPRTKRNQGLRRPGGTPLASELCLFNPFPLRLPQEAPSHIPQGVTFAKVALGPRPRAPRSPAVVTQVQRAAVQNTDTP